jgi:hypothetical protein
MCLSAVLRSILPTTKGCSSSTSTARRLTVRQKVWVSKRLHLSSTNSPFPTLRLILPTTAHLGSLPTSDRLRTMALVGCAMSKLTSQACSNKLLLGWLCCRHAMVAYPRWSLVKAGRLKLPVLPSFSEASNTRISSCTLEERRRGFLLNTWNSTESNRALRPGLQCSHQRRHFRLESSCQSSRQCPPKCLCGFYCALLL